MQNFRQRFPDVSARFAVTVDDSAEVGFVNTQHLRQPVLTHPDGVDSQLQVWIDISINCHCLLPIVAVPVTSCETGD